MDSPADLRFRSEPLDGAETGQAAATAAIEPKKTEEPQFALRAGVEIVSLSYQGEIATNILGQDFATSYALSTLLTGGQTSFSWRFPVGRFGSGEVGVLARYAACTADELSLSAATTTFSVQDHFTNISLFETGAMFSLGLSKGPLRPYAFLRAGYLIFDASPTPEFTEGLHDTLDQVTANTPAVAGDEVGTAVAAIEKSIPENMHYDGLGGMVGVGLRIPLTPAFELDLQGDVPIVIPDKLSYYSARAAIVVKQ